MDAARLLAWGSFQASQRWTGKSGEAHALARASVLFARGTTVGVLRTKRTPCRKKRGVPLAKGDKGPLSQRRTGRLESLPYVVCSCIVGSQLRNSGLRDKLDFRRVGGKVVSRNETQLMTTGCSPRTRFFQCHSRGSGNPVFCQLRLDSRFRGNDGQRRAGHNRKNGNCSPSIQHRLRHSPFLTAPDSFPNVSLHQTSKVCRDPPQLFPDIQASTTPFECSPVWLWHSPS